MEWQCRITTPPTAIRTRYRRSSTGTLTFLASAVFDLLGRSGSVARTRDRPSKLRAEQRTPSPNDKRTLLSAGPLRVLRWPEGWPPGALRGQLVAGKSPHGHRRRSLHAWETVHKSGETRPTASRANV